MGVRSARSWRAFVRVFRDIYFGGLVVGARRVAVFLDHAARLLSVFFADQDDRASYARKHILDSVHGSEIGIDLGRVEQAFDDEGLRFLLGVEDLHQLLVGAPSRGHGTFCHNSSSGGRWGEFCWSRGVAAVEIVTLRG